MNHGPCSECWLKTESFWCLPFYTLGSYGALDSHFGVPVLGRDSGEWPTSPIANAPPAPRITLLVAGQQPDRRLPVVTRHLGDLIQDLPPLLSASLRVAPLYRFYILFHTASRHDTSQYHFLRGNDTPLGNIFYESIRRIDSPMGNRICFEPGASPMSMYGVGECSAADPVAATAQAPCVTTGGDLGRLRSQICSPGHTQQVRYRRP